MARLEITIEQILNLIQQLPRTGKRAIFEFLRQDLADESGPLRSD